VRIIQAFQSQLQKQVIATAPGTEEQFKALSADSGLDLETKFSRSRWEEKFFC
jgi:hypothetical protein